DAPRIVLLVRVCRPARRGERSRLSGRPRRRPAGGLGAPRRSRPLRAGTAVPLALDPIPPCRLLRPLGTASGRFWTPLFAPGHRLYVGQPRGGADSPR